MNIARTLRALANQRLTPAVVGARRTAPLYSETHLVTPHYIQKPADQITLVCKGIVRLWCQINNVFMFLTGEKLLRTPLNASL